MCGRYVVAAKTEKIEKRFNVTKAKNYAFDKSYNISVANLAPVITSDQPKILSLLEFGFTPHFAKKKTYVLNARTEGDGNPNNDPNYKGVKGIITKPYWRESFLTKRCLVIADAFVEGPEKEKLNKPHLVYLRDQNRPFAFAGLWDEWVDQSTGEITRSFAILTTASNEVTSKIGHHRCPLVLPANYEAEWLDTNRSLEEVTQLLVPTPANILNAYPISHEIKNPRSEGIDLIKPTGEALFPD